MIFWIQIALTILTGIIICNMSILLVHIQFKVILIRSFKVCISKEALYNVNDIRKKFDINLGWSNSLGYIVLYFMMIYL